MAGKIHPRGSLFLRVGHCSAKSSSGQEYELNTLMHGAPCVRSEATGKYYVISWEEILGMAIEAGIDEAEAPHAP